MTIPPPLRAYAGLDRDLVVIGASTRVEIWDAGAWEAYLDDSEDAFADVDVPQRDGAQPGTEPHQGVAPAGQ